MSSVFVLSLHLCVSSYLQRFLPTICPLYLCGPSQLSVHLFGTNQLPVHLGLSIELSVQLCVATRLISIRVCLPCGYFTFVCPSNSLHLSVSTQLFVYLCVTNELFVRLIVSTKLSVHLRDSTNLSIHLFV